MMNRRRLLQGLGLALALPAHHGAAQGQAGRPLRLIVTLAPGSAIDIAARILAPQLAIALGQPVVVDNKPGGESVPGMQDMLRAPHDGNTLFLGSLSPLAVNVSLVPNLPYDPRRDLQAIAGAFTTNHVLVVKASFPARSFEEFLTVARQRQLSIGHATTLVQAQIATLSRMAGISLLPVPYRGTPATITDVLGGTLDATLLDPANALANVNGGQMRALGVTSLRRNPLTPDWPAISETLPGFDFSTWTAFVGPRGMPHEAVARLSTGIAAAFRTPEVADRMKQIGFVPWFIAPDDLAAHIEAETTRWIRLVQETGIAPQ